MLRLPLLCSYCIFRRWSTPWRIHSNGSLSTLAVARHDVLCKEDLLVEDELPAVDAVGNADHNELHVVGDIERSDFTVRRRTFPDCHELADLGWRRSGDTVCYGMTVKGKATSSVLQTFCLGPDRIRYLDSGLCVNIADSVIQLALIRVQRAHA